MATRLRSPGTGAMAGLGHSCHQRAGWFGTGHHPEGVIRSWAVWRPGTGSSYWSRSSPWRRTRAFLDTLSLFPFPHAAYPVACTRVMEILGLLGLLAGGPAADTGLPAARISRTVADLLSHQPGCAHPGSDGFAVSMIAPVLLTAGHDATSADDYLRRAAVWTLDRYDPEYGGAGPVGTVADPGTEAAWLLGSAFQNCPPRRPWSYAATVLADLAAVVPGGSGLFGDVVDDFLAVDASPVLIRADERRAQWRPDRTGTAMTVGVAYAEPLPPDGVAGQALHRPGAARPAVGRAGPGQRRPKPARCTDAAPQPAARPR
jgi:hypothetical protein